MEDRVLGFLMALNEGRGVSPGDTLDATPRRLHEAVRTDLPTPEQRSTKAGA